MNLAVLVFSIGPAAPTAYAEGTPLFATGDPGTPGAGRWEINVVWVGSEAGEERTFQLPLLEFNYGIGDHIQLAYATALLIERDPENARRSGFDYSTVGIKWRFRSETEHKFDLSINPQFSFRVFGSPEYQDVDVDEETFVLPVQWQTSRGRWVFFGEFGFSLPSESPGAWLYGVAAYCNWGPSLSIGAELNGETDRSLSEDQLAVNIGIRVACGSSGSLLVTFGKDVRRRREAPSARTLIVGWQFNL